MRLRSGAISSHFLGSSFLGWWTYSLEATRVSHSAVQASESEQTTQDTSGHLYQPELLFCDQVSVSLKTSKDISRWGCPTLSKTWDAWVIEQRGAYSARLNAARHTSAKESSSSPTVTANEDSYRIGGNSQQSKCLSAMARRGEMSGQAAWTTPTPWQQEESLDSWATRKAKNKAKGYNGNGQGTPLDMQVKILGLLDPANPNTHGSRPESWATPRCSMAQDKQEDSGKRRLGEQAQNGTTGKLNPRWVETLMGLPVGWTMPSCQSPATIVQTSCACSETESSQQQQP